jgi:hypothetical protein
MEPLVINTATEYHSALEAMKNIGDDIEFQDNKDLLDIPMK